MTQYIQTYRTTRLGVGDVVAIQGAHPVTVSLDKESGAYTAGLVYTDVLDANLRNDADWQQLSAVDASDVVDMAVPSTAKAVATRVTVISGETTPRAGAKMVVCGSNLLGLHQRRNHASGRQGDFTTPPAPSLPVIDPPGNEVLWYDFDDISTLFQDDGASVPVTADGQIINSITNKGSATTNTTLTSNKASIVAGPTYRTDQIGGRSAGEYQNPEPGHGLVSPGNIALAAAPSRLSLTLIVCRNLGIIGPSAGGAGTVAQTQTWFVYSMSDFGSGRISISGKSFQGFTNAGTPTSTAIWGRTGATDDEASVSNVVGTDSYVYTPSLFETGLVGIGSSVAATQLFLDNTVVSEVMFWSEGGVPATGVVETYVTDKYGIAWA